jgi:hypothetical protein
MKKEQIIKRLQWSIEERDWEAVKLLKEDLLFEVWKSKRKDISTT